MRESMIESKEFESCKIRARIRNDRNAVRDLATC
jgi:hypothetical protein